VTIPNFITIARLFSVPAIVYLILTDQFRLAFYLFLLAGISDGVDGFLAKRFKMASELGAYLDPIADKALLTSIYLALTFKGLLPLWLTMLVVSRDILIIGAVVLSWIVGKPVAMAPLMISKINTTGQIGLAAYVLAGTAFALIEADHLLVFSVVVAGLTILSTIAYMKAWLQHMSEPFETSDRGR
jgi:cardiolipin synthase